MRKIKIQEEYYELDDEQIQILHKIALSFQDRNWTKQQFHDAIRELRASRVIECSTEDRNG